MLRALPHDVPYRFLIILAFIIELGCVPAAAAVLAEFPCQYREGLLWVEVSVTRSSEPLHFLLDTGAGASVINFSTAKRLGLKLGREVKVRGVRTTLPGYWTKRVTARAGNIQLPGDYIAVDLARLSGACERPIDGLIGADFFRDRVVQIDFAAQRILVLSGAQPEESDAILPLQMRRCGLRVPISVNDRKNEWVRLDTGCATALQWVTAQAQPDQCEHRVAVGLAEVDIPQSTTTVRIAGHQFENVPTGLHDTALFPGEAGLLGNGLLSRFPKITIDAKTGRLILSGG